MNCKHCDGWGIARGAIPCVACGATGILNVRSPLGVVTAYGHMLWLGLTYGNNCAWHTAVKDLMSAGTQDAVLDASERLAEASRLPSLIF
jgi:hypothetical protein